MLLTDGRLLMKEKDERTFLKEYDINDYEKPSVAVDLTIFTIANVITDNYRKLPEKELRILLIKRNEHPFKDKWALPGGFVQTNETLYETAKRELREETGISCEYLEQIYTFSNPNRDPRAWIMSCAHMALVDSEKVKLCPGDDANDAAWFCLNVKESSGRLILELTNSNIVLRSELTFNQSNSGYKIVNNDGLAFDHAIIIFVALERLKSDLQNPSVIFNLLPQYFTLSELQQSYEVILNKQLVSAAFRRKIKSLVETTGEFTSESGHRPSQIYKYKKTNKHED